MLVLLPASAAANTRIIVKRDPGLSAAERADIRADAGVRLVETLPLPRTEIVTPGGDVRDALRELNADPDVVYAEPDYIRHAATPPDDYFFNFLWALHNTGQETPDFPTPGSPPPMVAGTDDADMDVLEAWDHTSGAGQLVAVVDSGVETTHEDLVGNTAPGYDWVDEDTDPQDSTGHGTLVAGTIAARSDVDDTTGIAGVAPDARILPLRVLDETNSGYVSDIVGAFDFAGDAGVHVVNASFASGQYSQPEYDAIAAHPDTLFVVAAGNREEGEDPTTPEYPCAYPLPNIVCVGASDADDKVPDFSNVGVSVDLFAPGDRIFSTFLSGAYNLASGTSMAAPHVAGEAALILARDPRLDVDALKVAVLETDDEAVASAEPVTRPRANALNAVSSVTADRDGDGVLDGADNCVAVPNSGQEDGDDNTIGDACEVPKPDSDSDGISDDMPDACPYDPGTPQAQGCPGTAGNSDADSVLDIFDNCDSVANADQRDLPDGDGIGDACDSDLDNDGDANGGDNCPVNYNPTQADRDGDGRGDVCDGDRDGDGRLNGADSCPDDYGTLANGCPAPPPANRDGDDRVDSVDYCPTEYAITNDGCPLPQVASLSGKVRTRGTRRSVTVKIRTTRLAMVRVTIERKKLGRWVRVARATRGTVSNRVTIKAARLKRGRHRVRVSIYNGAGSGTPASTRFRVR